MLLCFGVFCLFVCLFWLLCVWWDCSLDCELVHYQRFWGYRRIDGLAWNLQFTFFLRLNVCNDLTKAMKALDGKKVSGWTWLPCQVEGENVSRTVKHGQHLIIMSNDMLAVAVNFSSTMHCHRDAKLKNSCRTVQVLPECLRLSKVPAVHCSIANQWVSQEIQKNTKKRNRIHVRRLCCSRAPQAVQHRVPLVRTSVTRCSAAWSMALAGYDLHPLQNKKYVPEGPGNRTAKSKTTNERIKGQTNFQPITSCRRVRRQRVTQSSGVTAIKSPLSKNMMGSSCIITKVDISISARKSTLGLSMSIAWSSTRNVGISSSMRIWRRSRAAFQAPAQSS